MTVYLLHIEPRLRHSGHYIGFVGDPNTLDERVRRHANGSGGVLPREAVKRGSKITVAHVWQDAPHEFERYVKRYGGATRYCPLCGVNSRPIPKVENMRKEE